MPAFYNLLAMACFMGIASFGVGMIPLSVTLAKKYLTSLSTLGTGLLLGAALGVIIPEGIEGTIASNTGSQPPTFKIAFCILVGFAFMYLVEQNTSHDIPYTNGQIDSVHFDVALEELERQEGITDPGGRTGAHSSPTSRSPGGSKGRANPLSMGLFLHSLVDGYALGVSAVSSQSLDLSVIVFLAILVHKAPTALGLTTSLLSMSLSSTECKRHLVLFSLATPVGAILSYTAYDMLGTQADDGLVGSALLFSGGTFLYVAAVLQPVSDHAPPHSEGIGKMSRTLLTIGGMFLPLMVTTVMGHGHS